MATQQAPTRVEKFTPSSASTLIFLVMIAIGAVTMIAGLGSHPTRVWPAYLTSYFFFTSLGLGGLFFTAIHHATKAGWSTSLRRIPEAFTSFVPS